MLLFKLKSIMQESVVITIFLIVTLGMLFPEWCFAASLSGTGPFDDLLISILEILEGSLLTATLVVSVVGFGISYALFHHNRETMERATRIVLGLIIAVQGTGVVAGALNLSFLI